MSKIKDMIDAHPKVFNKWTVTRIKKNQNAIIIFNGGTGSGKSYAGITCALDLASDLGTNFSIKNNLSFKFTDALTKMGLSGNDKPGTVFVMEEVGSFGSGASAREWQSQANKFFFSFMQTSRHRNQILILNCPSFHYLEKGTRELVHFQFEANGISIQEGLSFFKPFYLQVNTRTGKIFFKYLRYTHQGARKVLRRMAFRLPPVKVRNDYERAKCEFTDNLNKSIMERSNGVRQKSDTKIKQEERKAKIYKYIEDGKTPTQTAILMKMNYNAVYRHYMEHRILNQI